MKKLIIMLCLIVVSFIGTNEIQAQDGNEYLGGITMFAGNFAPRGWMFCHGQILPINQYQSLYSLLGTTYGGDGRTTFALPDLRGRVAIHKGRVNGAGADRILGQKLGAETETLNATELPNHTHAISSITQIAVSTTIGEEGIGNGQHLTNHLNGFNTTATDDKTLTGFNTTATVANTGGNQAHNNMQPYLTINYIICVQGLFPSRN